MAGCGVVGPSRRLASRSRKPGHYFSLTRLVTYCRCPMVLRQRIALMADVVVLNDWREGVPLTALRRLGAAEG